MYGGEHDEEVKDWRKAEAKRRRNANRKMEIENAGGAAERADERDWKEEEMTSAASTESVNERTAGGVGNTDESIDE